MSCKSNSIGTILRHSWIDSKCELKAVKQTCIDSNFKVMPFDNTLVKANISGFDLKQMMDDALKRDWFQVSGLCVVAEMDAKKKSSLKKLFRSNGDGTCSNVEIDLSSKKPEFTASTIEVVMPNVVSF